MRIKTSFAIATLLALGLIGWLWSGQIDKVEPGDDQATATDEIVGKEAQLMAVQVRDLVAETIGREIIANGKTAAVRHVQIRGETSGRVIALGPDEGDLVTTGERLLSLDPRDREALVLQAKATLRLRRIELDAAKRLGEKGFQAETKVAQAEAFYATAGAALKHAELDLEHTVIKAPFTGILDHRNVEIGDFVDIGDPIAIVVDQDPFLVIGEVIETEVGRLEPGMPGVARLATGETVSGKLRYIASQADEQTRTFEVELEVPNAGGRLAVGVSAELRIAVERVLAHRVSPSVLTLNDDGVLGVKTVDANDLVVFKAVEIVHAEEDRVWLTGLPKKVRLITVGQGFVRAGIQVKPVPVSADRPGPVVSEAVQ